MPSNNLPLLPGYRIETKPKDDYKKSHIFGVSSNIRTVNEKGGDQFADSIAPLTAHKSSLNVNEFPERYPKTANEVLAQPPAWVAYDRKVLRFYCYFTEKVASSAQEQERVRKCVLYLYLEDESVHIAEPKVQNSGIPQGTFVKRHRIPRADGSGFVSVQDLAVGADLAIYGRTFHITDCDGFTRSFYEENGMALKGPEHTPMDRFTKTTTHRADTHHKLMNPMKQHMEASLGKPIVGMNVRDTQRFLRNDGKVLRFFCVYDDVRMFGEKRPYILHYFLADETVEVLELHQPNSGRSPFPTMLKRAKLPIGLGKGSLASVASIGGSDDPDVRYYNEGDFRIGGIVNVYGRELFLCGCDAFTKQFYINNFNMAEEEFDDIEVDDTVPRAPKLAPPPHSGFGTEEDSLGSFLYLTPKLPKRDFKKLMQNDGCVMRFLGEFVGASAVDQGRRFIITYYLNNDTLGIFEKFERNSGFIGGKFLERGRVKNQHTGDYFRCIDFSVGKTIVVNNHQFYLIEADEYTRRYMANNPDLFSASQNEMPAMWDENPIQDHQSIGGDDGYQGEQGEEDEPNASDHVVDGELAGALQSKANLALANMPTAAALYAQQGQ